MSDIAMNKPIRMRVAIVEWSSPPRSPSVSMRTVLLDDVGAEQHEVALDASRSLPGIAEACAQMGVIVVDVRPHSVEHGKVVAGDVLAVVMP